MQKTEVYLLEFLICYQIELYFPLFIHFELFVLVFHKFYSVKFLVIKSKIRVFYIQIKTDPCKLIIQTQYLFKFVFYSMNKKVGHVT